MTALVTKHLPLVAGAPDGIKKLRALILELAVRGKLVPHDPSDEPIAVLLARTAAAKAALQPRGRAKAKKSPNELAGSHPYVIPSSWKWCCLADLVEVLNGRAYKKEELLEQGTPVLRVGNLFTSNHWYYSNLTLDEDRYCVPGDLLYAWSASFGPFIWTGERSIYHYHIWKLAPHSDADLSRRYLHDYLQAQTAAIKAAGHGVSMTHMTKEKMEQLPVPLPPLAEQHRIVAKVDELMALCDRLEADQADAEAAHAQLVQALLDSLTQASDAADFRASWQRLSEHFHTLFTTEASIDALKQTVSQLAVMGQLVKQDDADEGASVFLQRLDDARASHSADRSTAVRRRQPDSSEVADATFDTPRGWLWRSLGSILHITGGVTLGRKLADRKLISMPYLRVANVQRSYLVLDQIKEVEVPEDEVDKYKLAPGDLLVTEGGDWDKVGRTAIWRTELPVCLHQNHVFRARPLTDEFCSRWVELYLNASPARAYFAGSAKQTTNLASINMTQLRALAFPVPPLAEQHRIVGKVDELMALCDQLKGQLTEARQAHDQLATALCKQATDSGE